MTTDAEYGTDLECLEDLSPTMREVTGLPVLSQDLYHRLETPRGELLDDADYGKALANEASKRMTLQELKRTPHAYEEELRKDDRVTSVTTTAYQVDDRLRMRFDVETGRGPFKFTVGVDEAGELVLESLKS